MGLAELFIIAVGLSMDAFAVSICKGLSLGKIKFKHMCIAGFWFGGFQALMPAVGYFLGNFFADMVTKYAHWVAFILLAIIGGNMIKKEYKHSEITKRIRQNIFATRHTGCKPARAEKFPIVCADL